jgi:hypothetical protein
MISSKDAKPWYREPFVWLVIVIPATSVVMGAVMIALAVSSQDGLVVDDYYRRGLEINKVIERDEAAAAYRLEADLVLDASRGVVRATLVGSDAFVRPSMLRLALMHPTRSGLDQELFLICTACRPVTGTCRSKRTIGVSPAGSECQMSSAFCC